MTYAFIQDVPANPDIYAQIVEQIGDTEPVGMIAHIVINRPGGLRYVDVWETEADWDRFRDEVVEPAVSVVLDRYGIPHDHSLVSVEEIDVIDTWLGATAHR